MKPVLLGALIFVILVGICWACPRVVFGQFSQWWRAGGVPGGAVLGAYQAVGAYDSADALVNLNDPGTNDLTIGAAPAWDAGEGWIFDGAEYLISPFQIAKERSFFVRVEFTHTTAHQDIIGVEDGGIDEMAIAASVPGGVDWFELYKGASLEKESYSILNYDYVLAIVYDGVGSAAFINGANVGSLGDDSISSALDIVIGAANTGTGPEHYAHGFVRAVAIYDGAITDNQAAAISAAMMTMETPGVALPVTTADIPYTLATTGDVVIYRRELTAGDIVLGAGVWALVIVEVFKIVRSVARGSQWK